jgi:Spy/CpxP family protein refolding chaperone
MVAAERASWRNPRILSLLLLIFLCGALAGAITVRAGLHERLHRSASLPYWQSGRQEFSYETLRRELSLTPDQADRLKVILDDFVKYHDDLQAQIEDVRATGRNRIIQILTPDQRSKFEHLSQQLSAR